MEINHRAEAIYSIGQDKHACWYVTSSKSGRKMLFGYCEEGRKWAEEAVAKLNRASGEYVKGKDRG